VGTAPALRALVATFPTLSLSDPLIVIDFIVKNYIVIKYSTCLGYIETSANGIIMMHHVHNFGKGHNSTLLFFLILSTGIESVTNSNN
jgi:hypothetical protein